MCISTIDLQKFNSIVANMKKLEWLGVIILGLGFAGVIFLGINNELSAEPVENYEIIKIDGSSMTEYGLRDSELVKLHKDEKCEPGDICIFKCLVDKCINNEDNEFIKKLVLVDNNCYWFEGNREIWVKDDTEFHSFDSRVYGCLQPSEFEIEGVVR